ncbi:MAG TPA: histidine kinase [Chitinophagaceae bacterium]
MATFPLQIPQYTSKDVSILLGSMTPLMLIMNSIMFGNRYFSEWEVFFPATLVTFSFLASSFMVYGLVAVLLRNRLPMESQMTRRLAICITIFIFMSAVLVSIVLRLYELFGFLDYTFEESHFKQIFIALVITNIFLTFFNEGVAKFEKYKATATETEQLKKEYMKSQLIGLKSQMNPHFLFNSLNTLSSLIHENEEEAEDFLDHMSKVYRYLLRSNEEQLVTLETELTFIKSYYYLLKARHGEGLLLQLDIPKEVQNHPIPPLTLQFILEHALNQNTIGKDKPLQVHMYINGPEELVIAYNVQPKRGTVDESSNTALENIANKFRLLCHKEVIIEETPLEKRIIIPLILSVEMNRV